MAASPIRLAIVGSGNIASTHAAAVKLVPEAELAAVCSRNGEKARELAQGSTAQVFDSVERLLTEGNVDGLLIATPSGAHADSVLPALRAGRHVLCEKPLEINSERVSSMIEEASRQGVILAGFFPMRFGAGAEAIHQAMQAKRFGRVAFLSARVKWWRDMDYYSDSSWRGTRKLDGGGALINQGIHAVDLLQWIGGTVSDVSAYAGTLAHEGIEVEDTLSASLRFTHGALGTIEASTACYPGLDISLEVSGDNGTAILCNDRIEQWRFRDERPEDAGILAGTTSGVIKGGSSDPKMSSCEGHRRQIEAFCQAIRGENSRVIDGREAARAVAIVETIYRAVNSQKSEKVTYL